MKPTSPKPPVQDDISVHFWAAGFLSVGFGYLMATSASDPDLSALAPLFCIGSVVTAIHMLACYFASPVTPIKPESDE